MKIVLTAFWLTILASFLNLIPAPWGHWLKVIGAVLIVAHIIEFLVFHKAIKAKGHSVAKSVVMTLFFGILYVKQG